MAGSTVQEDGLPSAAALKAFDEGVAQIRAGLHILNLQTDWMSFGAALTGGGSQVGTQYFTISRAKAELEKIRSQYKTVQVAAEKVVRV